MCRTVGHISHYFTCEIPSNQAWVQRARHAAPFLFSTSLVTQHQRAIYVRRANKSIESNMLYLLHFFFFKEQYVK